MNRKTAHRPDHPPMPKGYRCLRMGETIQAGDEYLGGPRWTWVPVREGDFTRPADDHMTCIRTKRPL